MAGALPQCSLLATAAKANGQATLSAVSTVTHSTQQRPRCQEQHKPEGHLAHSHGKPISLLSPFLLPSEAHKTSALHRRLTQFLGPELPIIHSPQRWSKASCLVSFMHSILKRLVWKKHPGINHCWCQVSIQNTNRLCVLNRKNNPKVDINLLWCLRTCAQNTHWWNNQGTTLEQVTTRLH